MVERKRPRPIVNFEKNEEKRHKEAITKEGSSPNPKKAPATPTDRRAAAEHRIEATGERMKVTAIALTPFGLSAEFV
jgi:polynucleotide 5'-kinase involved in rRNA processing